LLETEYDWRGILVEYDSSYFKGYDEYRKKSHAILSDALEVDYFDKLQKLNFPTTIDYLQIDLEPSIGTTIKTLELLEETVFDTYTFATVTFEHDIYAGDYFNTRLRSREIFQKRGYILVCPDICHEGNPYEDWWIHPSCVSESKIKSIQVSESQDYKEIIKKIS
jgi:hypothetical protein